MILETMAGKTSRCAENNFSRAVVVLVAVMELDVTWFNDDWHDHILVHRPNNRRQGIQRYSNAML